jgi:hypothetical protein
MKFKMQSKPCDKFVTLPHCPPPIISLLHSASAALATPGSPQAFSTTVMDFTLSKVSLKQWNPIGNTGSFEVQVWDATVASGSPGAQVGLAIYMGLAQSLNHGFGERLLSLDGLSVPLRTTSFTIWWPIWWQKARAWPISAANLNPLPVIWLGLHGCQCIARPMPKAGGSDWGSPLGGGFYRKFEAIPEPRTIALLLLSAGIGPLLRFSSRIS